MTTMPKNSNKKKYWTRITAQATSLNKLHYDLRRQIGFSPVFLFEDSMSRLHPAFQREVDISDDKLIILQPLHLPLVPVCLRIWQFPTIFFHFYASQGPHSTVYSNEIINFFWLHDPIVDLVVAPNRACLCLKWRWHRGRCWSTLNRHGRIFYITVFMLSCHVYWRSVI